MAQYDEKLTADQLKAILSPLNQNIAAGASAIIVRALPPDLDLALGRLAGRVEDAKFGSFVLSDAADVPDDVWDFASDDINAGSTIKTFPTVSGDLFVSSDSASDTAVEVTAEYIDSTGAEAVIVLTPTGLTPLDFGANGFDVNRAEVTGDTAPVGNLYFTTASNHTLGVPDDITEVLAFIRAGHGQTQQSQRTVGLGKTARIKFVDVTISRAGGAAGSAEIDLCVREFGKTFVIKRRYFPTVGGQSGKPEAGLIFPARASITFRAVDISANDTNCTVTWELDLVDD